MAEKLGTATLELVADGTRLGKDLDSWEKEAGTSAKRGGERFKEGVSKATLPATAALGAVVAGAHVAIDAAGDLGEQVSKNNVVFGKSGKDINAWSKTTAKAFGISQNAALEATGTFGNMLIPMGIGKKRAAEMSKTMVGLAADMASFNNASPEETLAAISSGLAGESEPLRRFGVFLNADRIAAEAMALGLGKAKKGTEEDAAARIKATDALLNEEKARKKLEDAVKKHGKGSLEARDAQNDLDKAQLAVSKSAEGSASSLSAAAKAQATYSLIMKDMQKSGSVGDFARTSTSAANAQRIQAAEAENLKVKIGQGLLPIMKMYQTVLATVTGFMAGHVGAVKIAVGIIGGLAIGVLAVNAALKVYAAATAAARVATVLFNAALAMNPIGLVAIALIALGAAFVVAYKKSETFRDIVDRALGVVRVAFDKVKTAGQAVANFLDGPLGVAIGAAKLYIAAWKLVIGTIVTALDKVADGIRWIANTGVTLIGKTQDKLTGPLGAIRDAFSGVADNVKAIFDWVSKVIDRIQSLIGWIGKIHIPKINIPFLPGGSEIGKRSVGGGNYMGAVSKLWDEVDVGRAMGLTLTSGLRPGDPGDHGRGHAVDMAGPVSTMTSYALGMFGRPGLKDVIWGGLNFWQDNGRMVQGWAGNMGLRADHLDHVHVSAFDQGGWLMPGITLAENNTGRPEAVVPLDGPNARPEINVYVEHLNDETAIELVASKIIRRLGMP